jgi:hypothetical protein
MEPFAVTPCSGDRPESDDALRRVYGEHARFSRIGAFTLVHLDDPAPEELSRREREFDPDDFFFDDCPLCAAAKAEGGHIVFDGADDDPLRTTTYGPPSETEEPSPGAAFDRALEELAIATSDFASVARGEMSDELAAQYDADVLGLHERFVETLWAEESSTRIEVFERLLARALTTLAAVVEREPARAAAAARVEAILERLAAIWRAL